MGYVKNTFTSSSFGCFHVLGRVRKINALMSLISKQSWCSEKFVYTYQFRQFCKKVSKSTFCSFHPKLLKMLRIVDEAFCYFFTNLLGQFCKMVRADALHKKLPKMILQKLAKRFVYTYHFGQFCKKKSSKKHVETNFLLVSYEPLWAIL